MAGKQRNRSGSKRTRRDKIGRPVRWHNAPNGKRFEVCGEIMRVGAAIVEIPKELDKLESNPLGLSVSAEEPA